MKSVYRYSSYYSGFVLGFVLIGMAVYQTQLWRSDQIDPIFQFNCDRQVKLVAIEPVIIPFRYTPRGSILIPVKVNGRDLEFVLDTGSSISVLRTDKAFSITKENPTKIKTTTTASDGSIIHGTFCKVSELRLGKLCFQDVPMATRRYGDDIHSAGLLGGNILQNFVVTVDYEAKKLVLSAPNKTLKPSFQYERVIPFREYRCIPVVQAIIDKKIPVTLVVDTGACTSSVSEARIKPFMNGSVRKVGEFIGPVSKQGYSVESFQSLELGNLILPNPIFSITLQAAGIHDHGKGSDILGNDILSKFRVTFDYFHKQILLSFCNGATAAHKEMEGRYYCAHGNFRQSINSFKTAMELEPEFALHEYINMANSHYFLGDYLSTIDECNKAIKVGSKDAYCNFLCALAYQRLGRYREAIDYFSRAIEEDDQFVGAYSGRAGCYRQTRSNILATRDEATAKRISQAAH